MKISNKFKPYVQDYKVMVFDIAFLEDDVIDKFTSDFKLIAKFFKNKRLGNPGMFGDEEIDHIAAFMDFLAVFTGDDRYRKIKRELKRNVCKQYRKCCVEDILKNRFLIWNIPMKNMRRQKVNFYN